MKKFLLSIFTLILSLHSLAQCAVGEVTLYLNITVDNWPYETYWELVPGGSGCGNNVIDWGSNPDVGCDNIEEVGESEYAGNSIVTEGPICLVAGEFYDLIFNDSYGDGGLNFELIEDGVSSHLFFSVGYEHTWTFQAGIYDVVPYDSPCAALQVIPNSPPAAFNNFGALGSFLEVHPPGLSCNAPGNWCQDDAFATNSVWAFFTAVEGMSYEITTCTEEGSFDTQLAVYHTTDCGDFSTFELIGANDDVEGGCSLTDPYASTCHVSCLIDGDVYYIQIDGWEGDEGNTHLAIIGYEGEVTQDAIVDNINCPLDKGEEAFGAIYPYLIGEGINFSCEWTGPNNFTSNDAFIADVPPGEYAMTLTSPCGLLFEETYTISEPAPWNVVVTPNSPTCPQSGDGSVSLTVNGATAPFDFQWTSTNFSSDAQNINNLDDGVYFLVIDDDNGCNYETSVSLFSTNDLELTLGNDTVVCINASYDLVAPPGLIYLWQDGNTNQSYHIDASQFPLGPNTLVLYVESEDGCSASDVYFFDVQNCIGVSEINKNALSFQIAPNPIQQMINITSSQRMDGATLSIYDGLGKSILFNTSINGTYISLPINIASGVYTVCISNDEMYSYSKMVKE